MYDKIHYKLKKEKKKKKENVASSTCIIFRMETLLKEV